MKDRTPRRPTGRKPAATRSTTARKTAKPAAKTTKSAAKSAKSASKTARPAVKASRKPARTAAKTAARPAGTGPLAKAPAKGRAAPRSATRPAARRRPTGRVPATRLAARRAGRRNPARQATNPVRLMKEFLVHTDDLEWAEKSLAGLSHKMLWRDEATGATIALIRFEKGSGIPEAHRHASNQFMFCLSGKYRYIPSGLTLIPGAFYCNPKGAVHGPTIADETSIFLEMYDGPHYPVRPSWYDNDDDAR